MKVSLADNFKSSQSFTERTSASAKMTDSNHSIVHVHYSIQLTSRTAIRVQREWLNFKHPHLNAYLILMCSEIFSEYCVWQVENEQSSVTGQLLFIHSLQMTIFKFQNLKNYEGTVIEKGSATYMGIWEECWTTYPSDVKG